MAVTADGLDAAVSDVVAALRPAAGRDWSVRAGDLDWDCWHTAEHIGDALLSYAVQLAVRPAQRYVRFLATAEEDASGEEVVEFAEAGGRLLVAAVRAAVPGARAYHPSGLADPEGFAAMGCVEVLVHGQDIAQGLGLSFEPDRDTCRAALARLFPDTPADLAGTDSWGVLQWAAGRSSLPGHPRLQAWGWHGAPLGKAPWETAELPELQAFERTGPAPVVDVGEVGTGSERVAAPEERTRVLALVVVIARRAVRSADDAARPGQQQLDPRVLCVLRRSIVPKPLSRACPIVAGSVIITSAQVAQMVSSCHGGGTAGHQRQVDVGPASSSSVHNNRA